MSAMFEVRHGPTLRQTIEESLLSLWTMRRRSILALIGIIVGCGSVVALINIGKNASNEVLKAFEGLGTNTILVNLSPRPNTSKRAPSVMSMDMLKKAVPTITFISPLVFLTTKVRYKNREVDGMIVGGTTDLPAVLGLTINEGRNLSRFDAHSIFAIAGASIARDLGLQIGSKVQIGGYLFQIVGILSAHPPNPMLSIAPDTTLLIPLANVRRLTSPAEISGFAAQVKDAASAVSTAALLEAYLSDEISTHNVSSQVSQQLLDGLKRQSETLTYLLAALGGISLFVAGIGIMNIMLTNVSERRREIGVRVALGARPRDIRNLFLVEALLLTFIGAVAGSIAGIVVAWSFAGLSRWEFVFSSYAVLLGIFSSLITGLIFGIQPAWFAANLLPVQALRDE